MGPINKQKSLNKIYGERGMGKTYLALGIAGAAATGTDFLRWTTRAHSVFCTLTGFADPSQQTD
jgi:putative DNA primase/helicase